MQTFDYIIVGSGCAGLSLAYYLCSSSFKDKRILLIDKALKNKNDRTWCFWEKENGTFEEIVHKSWQYLHFKNVGFEKKMDISPYKYKMIEGIDFYNFVNEEIAKHPNIQFLQAQVQSIENLENGAIIKTSEGIFQANIVFNSGLRPNISALQSQKDRYHYISQHFMGWVIETEESVFEEKCATFMDFTIPQCGETRFVYVLPRTHKIALIEATIFSNLILEQNQYEEMIQDYIHNVLKISKYKISHTEFGIIPMSNYPFSKHNEKHIIHIGTSGGNVKSSSGFAFKRIQENMQRLVQILSQYPDNQVNEKYKSKQIVFPLFDSMLLNIMLNKRMELPIIFQHLFDKNPSSLVLKFLDEQTSLVDNLKIMRSVPSMPFIKALIQEIPRISAS
jgi:lycopene beta-cyclase